MQAPEHQHKVDADLVQKLSATEKLDYYQTKSFREVNPLVDAPLTYHPSMVGHRHNQRLDHPKRNPYQDSSDEEDAGDDLTHDRMVHDDDTRLANFNKQLWMKTYSLRFEIPTTHVLNARTFTSGDDKHVMQLVKFILPSEVRTQMKIEPPLPFFDALNKKGNIMLRVLKRKEGASINLVDWAILEFVNDDDKATGQALNPISAFSQDGTHFAYLVEEQK
jgi:hypothetical protein